MTAYLMSRVFDGEGCLVTGGGMLGAAASWELSKFGSGLIMVLTIAVLSLKLAKSIRDFKRKDKDE